MIDPSKIFPECYADTLLVQLVLRSRMPHHCKNIHNVASALERHSNDNIVVIGLVDNDKNMPTYIKEFKTCIHKEQESLTILNLPDTQKYVIRLHPAFEKWILAVAESCGVKMAEYGFEDFNKFKNASKGESVYDNKELKKFINAVIDKDPPAIQTLRHWLSKAVIPAT